MKKLKKVSRESAVQLGIAAQEYVQGDKFKQDIFKLTRTIESQRLKHIRSLFDLPEVPRSKTPEGEAITYAIKAKQKKFQQLQFTAYAQAADVRLWVQKFEYSTIEQAGNSHRDSVFLPRPATNCEHLRLELVYQGIVVAE